MAWKSNLIYKRDFGTKNWIWLNWSSYLSRSGRRPWIKIVCCKYHVVFRENKRNFTKATVSINYLSWLHRNQWLTQNSARVEFDHWNLPFARQPQNSLGKPHRWRSPVRNPLAVACRFELAFLLEGKKKIRSDYQIVIAKVNESPETEILTGIDNNNEWL